MWGLGFVVLLQVGMSMTIILCLLCNFKFVLLVCPILCRYFSKMFHNIWMVEMVPFQKSLPL